ncbi:hypothetical protein LOAG_00745 [Loa loa]|uniref:Uncharacterized protein n=1 Tax=Loa loa TaxID=7209 RepID=A0A1S0UAL3_LOALO|nr:hypothetical protein LOAG_00745 [Loa loa]EFO27743.1 hypothetical protein LOAG_00745 [Loa loa]
MIIKRLETGKPIAPITLSLHTTINTHNKDFSSQQILQPPYAASQLPKREDTRRIAKSNTSSVAAGVIHDGKLLILSKNQKSKQNTVNVTLTTTNIYQSTK